MGTRRGSGSRANAAFWRPHAGERIEYDVNGLRTRFNQTAAIIGAPVAAGMHFVSGLTLNTVRDGIIDAGRFIPLGLDAKR